MTAAGVARRTVQVWVEIGLLPTPRMVVNAGGMFTRFPAWAVERARFVAKKRTEGFTIEEVRSMLDRRAPSERTETTARSRNAG